MGFPTHKAIVERVVHHYLTSNDFNGYPVRQLSGDFGIASEHLSEILAGLVQRGRVTIVTAHEGNPYIKRFPDLPKAKQLELMANSDLSHACIYPSRSCLRRVVKPSRYEGSPFTVRLALGEPQLIFHVFDLSVLEAYRNDPRYYYYADDISGRISMHAKPSRKLPKSDQVLLESFGFAYSKRGDRAVAVFLRYLSGFSPEHQRIWQAKSLPRHLYTLHSDYFRSAILGEWHKGMSVFAAVLEEMEMVNAICGLIGWQQLFTKTFKEERPAEFGFMLRPTLAAFNAFVHLLDKMLSDNLNRDFFRGKLELESEQKRKDGRIEVRQKGTIQLLDEWFKQFTTPDRTPLDEMISAFKDVRQLRQRPAHAVNQDAFDEKYYHQQREVMARVYDAVRTIRLAFAAHPGAGGFQTPSWLRGLTVWMQ